MRVWSTSGTVLFVDDRADPHALQRERLRRLVVGPLQALQRRPALGGVRQQRVHRALVAALPGGGEGRDRLALGGNVAGADRDARAQREDAGRGERGEPARIGDRVSTAGARSGQRS